MIVIKSPRFERAYKKLHANQLVDANNAIAKVIEKPDIGEQKKGDLGYLRVYKFSMVNQLTLLGYYLDENDEIVLTLIAIGSHENFYRDLKN